MATLAEPMVSDAIESLIDSRVSVVSPLSRSIVFSTSSRPHSVPTTTPARIWPSSIMLATWIMPVSMPEAGVRDVVDHRVAREVEAVMDAAGGGRLQIVAADRAVDECAEVAAVDAAGGDRLLGRLDADGARPVPGGKNRRSRMPVISSSRPSGSRRRW